MSGQSLLYQADGDLKLTNYCDAYWGACPLTRQSLTGYIFFLGGSPISWKTTKQDTFCVPPSRTSIEVKWLNALLWLFGVEHHQPIPLHCDSKSSMHIANNFVFHERTKHIEIDCHHVRDVIHDCLLNPHFFRTTDQITFIFTKALGSVQFWFLLKRSISVIS